MGTEAASFTVNGFHGALVVIAVILFAVAAVVAFFAPGHRAALALLALGAFCVILSLLVTG
jgi:hypothetical protein